MHTSVSPEIQAHRALACLKRQTIIYCDIESFASHFFVLFLLPVNSAAHCSQTKPRLHFFVAGIVLLISAFTTCCSETTLI
jgi:hypothetical protein